MSDAVAKDVTLNTLDALWTLFKSQPKSVRKAFTKKLIHEEFGADKLRNETVVRRSLTQAFSELSDAEHSGVELPDARELFK